MQDECMENEFDVCWMYRRSHNIENYYGLGKIIKKKYAGFRWSVQFKYRVVYKG